jgi:hypothetical protein
MKIVYNQFMNLPALSDILPTIITPVWSVNRYLGRLSNLVLRRVFEKKYLLKLPAVLFVFFFSNIAYSQCDTTYQGKFGTRFYIWSYTDESNATDLRDVLYGARNCPIVGTIEGCSPAKIDSLLAVLNSKAGSFDEKQIRKLKKRFPSGRGGVHLGVIIQFQSPMTLAQVFTVLNRTRGHTVHVDNTTNEILITTIAYSKR